MHKHEHHRCRGGHRAPSPGAFGPEDQGSESMLGARFRRMPFHRGWSHGGFPGPWMTPGPRARRGDVRTAVLMLLTEGPMHGYQLIQELESRSGGAWRPSPGSIYPTLELLEDQELVRHEEVEGKKVYSLTDAGRERATAEGPGTPPWVTRGEGDGESPQKLREAFFQLGAASWQIAQTGNEAQTQQALEVLSEARRRLYTILAEG